jgi:hypothetical protein
VTSSYGAAPADFEAALDLIATKKIHVKEFAGVLPPPGGQISSSQNPLSILEFFVIKI